MVLDEWVDILCREFELEIPIDTALLLDLARIAAHQVDRPAAPLTTFIVGYAAASRGGGPEMVRELAEVASRLAASWADGDQAPRPN